MTLQNIDTLVRIPIGGLAKYWTFYHILTSAALEVRRPELRCKGKDDITGLKIFEVRRKKPNLVSLYGLDSSADHSPLAAWVGDDGQFNAVYGQEEIDDILKIGAMKSLTRLAFNNRPWEIPVYEVFEYLPKSLVVGKHGVYGVDADLEGSLTVQLYSDFPCGVVHEEAKISQPDIWDRDDYQYYDYNLGVRHYWDRNVPRLPTEPSKSMCAYDATGDYLLKILGITLSGNDRDWYKKDDRVKLEGLPLEDTLTVLTELVSPYRVEIDRIWANEFVWSDELAEFAAKLKLDDEMYRTARSIMPGLAEPRMFRGVLPALEPIITFTRSATSPYPSGHASFLSSRAKRPGEWTLALAYRRR